MEDHSCHQLRPPSLNKVTGSSEIDSHCACSRAEGGGIALDEIALDETRRLRSLTRSECNGDIALAIRLGCVRSLAVIVSHPLC